VASLSEAVAVRPYRDRDETAINEAFNAVFGLRRPIAEWAWKFQAEPEGRWIYLAEDRSGRLLACYGALPVRFRLGGLVARAGQPVDVFSVPDARRSGVFTRCYEEFIRAFGNPDDLPLMFGFPGGVHYGMGLKLLRYVALRPVPLWQRGVRAGRPSLLGRPAVTRGFDPEASDALWVRAAERYPFAAVRDAAWQRRRYTGRPGVDYIHLYARRRGLARAWGVARLQGHSLQLADLVWDGSDARDLEALDRAFVSQARRAGAAHLEMWLAGDPAAAEALAARGWVQLPDPPDIGMVGRAFHPAIDLGEVGRRVYLTMGDSDLV
jgi:hypothetical protein